MSTGTATNTSTVSTAKQTVDKKFMYGRYDASEDRRSRFLRRLAHKHADLPMEDDVQIEANKTGIGALGAVGVAAMAGIPPTLLAMWALLMRPDPAPQAQPQPPVVTSPADSEYMIRFRDRNGNLIDVPRYQPQ